MKTQQNLQGTLKFNSKRKIMMLSGYIKKKKKRKKNIRQTTNKLTNDEIQDVGKQQRKKDKIQ